MSQPTTTPACISDTEFETLHGRLEEQFARLSDIPMHEALGMATAMLSGPMPVPARLWIELVLDASSFATKSEAGRFVVALTVAYAEIQIRLLGGHDAGPWSNSPRAVGAWCRGYADVVRTFRGWTNDEPVQQLLLPILLVADAPTGLCELDELDADWCARLRRLVRAIYTHWRSIGHGSTLT